MKLTFTVKMDKQTVFGFLTEADKFVSVHPLIYKMTQTGNNTYKVFEKMNIGFIPYYFTYEATVESGKSCDQVEINANIMGLTKIKMLFKLHNLDEATFVEEQISIKSYLPIKRMVHRLFKKQHALLFQNIENQTR